MMQVLEKIFGFFGSLMPWWLWLWVLLPFFYWVIRGCRGDEFQRNATKGMAWAATWVFCYMIYKLN
jgi:hypothetical protein